MSLALVKNGHEVARDVRMRVPGFGNCHDYVKVLVTHFCNTASNGKGAMNRFSEMTSV